MITSTRMHAEGKGRDAESANNFMRMAIISNNESVVNATQDERRFFALNCGEGNMQDHDFFRAMDDEMNSGGLEALMYELMHHVPAEGWSMLYKPPATPYLRAQQAHARNALDRFILELVREEGYEVEGGVAIELSQTRAIEVEMLELRTCADNYMRMLPPNERVKCGYPEIRAAAKRMVGANEFMRQKPGGMNRRSVLVFPPLRDAREAANREHGVIFDLPPDLDASDADHVVSIRGWSAA